MDEARSKQLTTLQWLQIALLLLTTLPFSAYATADLQRIRVGLHADFIRIVFDFNRPVVYHLDHQTDKMMLYVEMVDCKAPSITDGFQTISQNPIINSMFVKTLNDNKLLVRLESKADFSYRIDELENPWRLVVDILSSKPTHKPIRPSGRTNPYYRGLDLLKQQRIDEAIEAFEEASRDNRYYSLAYFQLGQIYHDRGDVVKALENFEKVTSRSSVWDEAQRNILRIQAQVMALAENELSKAAPADSIPAQAKPVDTMNSPATRPAIEPGTAAPQQSLAKILLIALALNSLLFAVFITINRRFQARKVTPPKYRAVSAATHRRGTNKSYKHRAYKKKTFEELIRARMKETTTKSSPAQPVKAAAPPAIVAADIPVPVSAPASAKPVQEKAGQPPEKGAFDISEKPVQKMETAYYRNVLRTTMGDTSPIASSEKPDIDTLIDQIEQLLAYNFDVRTIARELNLGQDEVRMMINIRKNRAANRQKQEKVEQSTNRITYA